GRRLQEVIAARIGGLHDVERTAVELIALSQPVGLTFIEDLAGPDASQSLERRGLLRAETLHRRIDIRLAHPLHAEVAISLLGPSAAAAHRRRLIDALLARGAGRADDALQLALWRADIGDVDDWEAL